MFFIAGASSECHGEFYLDGHRIISSYISDQELIAVRVCYSLVVSTLAIVQYDIAISSEYA